MTIGKWQSMLLTPRVHHRYRTAHLSHGESGNDSKTAYGVSLILMLFCLFSCASAPDSKKSSIPNFYFNPPNISGVIFGYGSGSSLAVAMQNAQDDIARQLEVSIESQIVIKTTEQSESIKLLSTQKVRNMILNNSKRAHLTVASSGDYHTLLYYLHNVPDTFRETDIIAAIRKKEKVALTTSTIFSSIIPGTGQLMNRQYVKGSLMLTGATALLGTIAFSLIGATDDLQKSQVASFDAMKNHYATSSRIKSTIALISALLYAGGGVWSGLDNYSSQNH